MNKRGLASVLFVLALMSAAAAAPVKTGPSAQKKTEQVVLKVPDFALDDVLSGAGVRLSENAGKKVILLVFSATWCPYCRKEYPVLKQLHEKYSGAGLMIINVDVREARERVEKFAREQGAGFTVTVDTDGAVAEAYGVNGIPLNILLDRKGNVLFRDNAFPDDMTGTIERELAGLVPLPSEVKKEKEQAVMPAQKK